MASEKGLTRRQFLTGASTTALATLVDVGALRATTRSLDQRPYTPTYFTAAEWAFIGAAVDRLIPHDGDGPGGVETGVPEFIDRQMELPYGHGAYQYMHGPFVPDAPASLGYQLKYNPRELYRVGVAAIDKETQRRWQQPFAQLIGEQQDQFLAEMEKNAVSLDGPPSGAVFSQLLANTKEGYFADPLYGGNRDMAAWKYIGFPGARADFTDWLDQAGRAYPFGPVSINGKIQRS